MDFKFEGKNVMITGAGRGIGRALAVQLDSMGANVKAVSKDYDRLVSLRGLCPRIRPLQIDLTDWDLTEKRLEEHVEDIDYLINCAGIIETKPIGEITPVEINDMFTVNYRAAVNMIQLVSKGMKKRNKGAIVNLSSVSGLAAIDGHAIYGSSKSALDMITKVAAKELGPFNIRVNSVNPTVVWTEMAEKAWADEKAKEAMKKKIPMDRFVSIDEVVYPVIFLLSDYAGMINGVTLPIDGGFTAC